VPASACDLLWTQLAVADRAQPLPRTTAYMQPEASASQRRLDVLTRQIVPGSTASSSSTALQHQQGVLPTLQRQPTAGGNAGMFAGQVVVITGGDSIVIVSLFDCKSMHVVHAGHCTGCSSRCCSVAASSSYHACHCSLAHMGCAEDPDNLQDATHVYVMQAAQQRIP
jgi:hypothetical protein